jgi:UPF0755 protein
MSNYYHSIKRREKRSSRLKKLVRWLLFIVIIGGGLLALGTYQVLFRSNVWLNGSKSAGIIIPNNSDWNEVKNLLYSKGLISSHETFEWVARFKNYPGHIKPGHYLLKEGMSNLQLVNKLRNGKQDPVNLVFNNIRTKEDLAGKLGAQLEADSASFIKLLNDPVYVQKFGMTPATIITMFIPNTYEIYWTTSPEKFMERMNKEFNNFWNETRKQKLGGTGLTRIQAMTLASIVEKESNKNDKKPVIAGVYMNRLKQGWLLQADPTLVFAIGDFTIKRVLNAYKTIDSPYNTYRYLGLPPGPICIPSISSIDAVLNYQQHDYMFFCAREDFSGYHNFAVTPAQHAVNAAKYQQALNQRGIMK